jgi:hypothetical protein
MPKRNTPPPNIPVAFQTEGTPSASSSLISPLTLPPSRAESVKLSVHKGTTPEEESHLSTYGDSSPFLQSSPLGITLTKLEVLDNEDPVPNDTIPFDITQKIILAYADKYGISSNIAIHGIARLVQDGGTNASKKQLKRNISGVTFDINDLRATITYHHRNGTVRKLAKTIRNEIAAIALHNEWHGPLVKDIQRTSPSLSLTALDKVFCNEIHSDNYHPNVPAKVREALQRREDKIKSQKRTEGKKKSKGKKK